MQFKTKSYVMKRTTGIQFFLDLHTFPYLTLPHFSK